MPLQAVIGQRKIKHFTKSLTCLSRYGDEVVLQANANGLILAATNSSRSAFCRVKFTPEYFVKYNVTFTGFPGSTFRTPPDEPETITGQIVIKALNSVLKHKTVEKSVERCEILIVNGGEDLQDDEHDEREDSLSSRMILRLHCKHGVVKTHRLILMTITSLFAPQIISSPSDSRITVGPRAIRDMLEHFPHVKGSKNDPQLVWLFGLNDVKVKSLRTASDFKGGKSQMSTEISMSADEFDSYQIFEPPVSLGFHLREFNATVSLAESLSVALEFRFTEATEPVYILFDTDLSDSEYLFVISTTDTVYDSTLGSKRPRMLKRDREDGEIEESAPSSADRSSRVMKKRPKQAAVAASSAEALQSMSMLLPSQRVDVRMTADQNARIMSTSHLGEGPEPLFMPGASQLSATDLEVLRDSGLGIDHMDYDEFEAMMEADGEEIGMSTKVGMNLGRERSRDAEDAQIDIEIPATQVSSGDMNFQPIFPD